MRRTLPVLALLLSLAADPAAAQDAERMYAEACEAGDALACNVFGLMLETGEGVERDFERAAELYGLACAQGMLAGCANLGILREAGRGVDRDVAGALELYLLACEGGEEVACERLSALGAAQPTTPTAGLRGWVTDAETGEPLPEALVRLPDLPMAALSVEDGSFAMVGLPVGPHRVHIERFGYLPVDSVLEPPLPPSFVIGLRRSATPSSSSPGRVAGRVRGEAGEPIGQVEVSVVGQSASSLSDAEGQFTLATVEPGLVRVRLSGLGYGERTVPVVVQPGEVASVVAMLSTRPLELEGLTVGVESQYLERSGFLRRAARGGGRHFDRVALERFAPIYLSDVLRRMPGIQLQWSPTGARQAIRRIQDSLSEGPCVIPIWVDGVPIGDSDIDRIPVPEIDAVEVYTRPAFMPVQYMTSPCGVVLIWTRR